MPGPGEGLLGHCKLYFKLSWSASQQGKHRAGGWSKWKSKSVDGEHHPPPGSCHVLRAGRGRPRSGPERGEHALRQTLFPPFSRKPTRGCAVLLTAGHVTINFTRSHARFLAAEVPRPPPPAGGLAASRSARAPASPRLAPARVRPIWSQT